MCVCVCVCVCVLIVVLCYVAETVTKIQLSAWEETG